MALGPPSVNVTLCFRPGAKSDDKKTVMFKALKSFFSRRFARRPVDRQAHMLYVATVEAARQQALFEEGGVADTLDGRFDMIILHLALVLNRLRQLTPEGEEGAPVRELETCILEVYFADMDQALREMGVGDLGVGKRVKVMAKAYMGRRLAYGAALEAMDSTGNRSDLEDALTRNAYRGEAPSSAALQWLGDYVVRQRQALEAQPLDAFMAGTVALCDAKA